MKQPWQYPRRLRRVLFAGINLAVGLIVTAFIVLPIRDGLARRDLQIAEQRTTLTRFQALADQETAVDAAAKQVPADTGEYLRGNNEGVIIADLQTRLKGMVESTGSRLRSVRSLPSQTTEQVRYVGSRIEIYGPLPAIHRAVAAIEASKPYLFVRAAVIKSTPLAGRQDIPQEPVIEAQLDVFGAERSAGSN